MLDVRNYALGITGHQFEPEIMPKLTSAPLADRANVVDEPIRTITPLDASSGKASVSLQEMINASVALKSNLNLGAEKAIPRWHHSLYPSSTPPSRDPARYPSIIEPKDHDVPSHSLQAVARLQREVLLLRNELNFELWLSGENIKHIGRLYQDRNVVVSAEAERQGLVGYTVLLRIH